MEINKTELKKTLRSLLKEIGESPQFDFSNKKIGDIISIEFRDVKIVVKKIGDNIFEIVNNGDSLKLKEGDVIKISDNQKVNMGDSIEFDIFRNTSVKYKSDPVKFIN